MKIKKRHNDSETEISHNLINTLNLIILHYKREKKLKGENITVLL